LDIVSRRIKSNVNSGTKQIEWTDLATWENVRIKLNKHLRNQHVGTNYYFLGKNMKKIIELHYLVVERIRALVRLRYYDIYKNID